MLVTGQTKLSFQNRNGDKSLPVLKAKDKNSHQAFKVPSSTLALLFISTIAIFQSSFPGHFCLALACKSCELPPTTCLIISYDLSAFSLLLRSHPREPHGTTPLSFVALIALVILHFLRDSLIYVFFRLAYGTEAM
jgi:hypothetical protein